MTITMTEAELQRLGFLVDPDNPSQAVPIRAEDRPDDSWTFDRLMTYGSAAVTESTRLLNEATYIARRSTIQIYRAGRALSLARNKVPTGKKWCECLKAHGIPRTNDWEARQLFKRAESEEAITLLTPTEAKNMYAITKPKKAKKEAAELPSTIIFPRTTEQDQSCNDDPCTSDDHDGLDAEDDLANAESDVEVIESDDQTESVPPVVDEVEDSEPPEHEPESVLRLLVKVNTALGLAVSMPVAEDDLDEIEVEIKNAHSLLDQIEAGVHEPNHQ